MAASAIQNKKKSGYQEWLKKVVMRSVRACWSAAPINSRHECMAVMGMPMSMVLMGRLADKREPRVEPPGRSERFMKI